VAAIVASLTAGALLLGGTLRKPAAAASPAPASVPAQAGQSLQTGFSAGNTESLIAGLQSSLRASLSAADKSLSTAGSLLAMRSARRRRLRAQLRY
jgi:hypothetical protein